MSAIARLNTDFGRNWTTTLAGWNGLDAFSPWPDRSDEFLPFLSPDDISAYANERLACSTDVEEEELIVRLLSLDLLTESRQTIRDYLAQLSNLSRGDPRFELRKWRLVLLTELLDNLPTDPLYGLIGLSEFWQGFGFPSDSPHIFQGIGNDITPYEYYQENNFQRVLARHRAWVEQESLALKHQETGDGARRETL